MGGGLPSLSGGLNAAFGEDFLGKEFTQLDTFASDPLDLFGGSTALSTKRAIAKEEEDIQKSNQLIAQKSRDNTKAAGRVKI